MSDDARNLVRLDGATARLEKRSLEIGLYTDEDFTGKGPIAGPFVYTASYDGSRAGRLTSSWAVGCIELELSTDERGRDSVEGPNPVKTTAIIKSRKIRRRGNWCLAMKQ